MSSIEFVRFDFNEAGMQHVFHSEEGPVGHYLTLVAEAVVVAADESILEVEPFYPHEGFPFSISGDLKQSVAYRLESDEDGVVAAVGANASHRGFNYPRALETGEASIYGTRFPWLSAACIALGLDYRPLI